MLPALLEQQHGEKTVRAHARGTTWNGAGVCAITDLAADPQYLARIDILLVGLVGLVPLDQLQRLARFDCGNFLLGVVLLGLGRGHQRKAHEQGHFEQFVAHATVKALGLALLYRLARRDVIPLHTDLTAPSGC